MRLAGRDASSGLVIRMLMRMNGRDLFLHEPLYDAELGKAQGTVKPAYLRFDAKLRPGLGRAGIIKAAEGDADTIASQALIGQWCAASCAEAAFGDVRTREGCDCAVDDDEFRDPHACEGHERTSACLLAHSAVADVDAGRLGDQAIAHCAALATSCQASRRVDRHRP